MSTMIHVRADANAFISPDVRVPLNGATALAIAGERGPHASTLAHPGFTWCQFDDQALFPWCYGWHPIATRLLTFDSPDNMEVP